jgi:hypothetical protein
MQSVEEAGLRWRTTLRQHHQIGRGCFALQMRQNPLDNRRVFNAADDLDVPRAPLAGLDVDIKHPFQPLHPGHRLVALGGRLVYPVLPCRLTPLASPAPLRRCHPDTNSLRQSAPVSLYPGFPGCGQTSRYFPGWESARRVICSTCRMRRSPGVDDGAERIPSRRKEPLSSVQAVMPIAPC